MTLDEIAAMHQDGHAFALHPTLSRSSAEFRAHIYMAVLNKARPMKVTWSRVWSGETKARYLMPGAMSAINWQTKVPRLISRQNGYVFKTYTVIGSCGIVRACISILRRDSYKRIKIPIGLRDIPKAILKDKAAKARIEKWIERHA